MNLPEKMLFINGEFKNGSSNESFENLNPAYGTTINHVSIASKQDVDDAVAAAKEGFKVWSRFSGTQRGRVLKKAADFLKERNEEIAKIEVMDTGKPLQEAIAVDIISGADAIEYFGGIAASLHGSHWDLGAGNFAYTRREPLGVVAGIGAWNYPIQIACWKSAPALACGNAMIFKPAEQTPLSVIFLAQAYKDAGLPDGVFNVVQGPGSVGQMLSLHPDIRKISLTGEIGTGKKVMADAANTLKQVTMELGGKSPLIVFEDADLENAVSAALMANFYTQGEICSNGTRVFVHKSIEKVFLQKVVERANKIIVGDPADPKTQMGSLISKAHKEKVLDYIRLGVKEGATLLCGGTELPSSCVSGKLAGGAFVKPTIFSNCQDSMTIVKEEIFGPVMTVLSFDSEEEVVERANDTQFGLAAGIMSQNLNRGHRVASRLEAGICWINNYNITPIEIPFGGCKQSGIGRENSLDAINHYSQLKSVYLETGAVEAPF